LAEQFSAAFDVYLDIQRRVNTQIKVALGYDTPNYRLLNVCPACFYKLENEPDLLFSFFCTFDGNNSLRRIAAPMHNMKTRLDSRIIESDRWLSPEEVNQFANEVQGTSVSRQAK
jgi:hypothetical protein